MFRVYRVATLNPQTLNFLNVERRTLLTLNVELFNVELSNIELFNF